MYLILQIIKMSSVKKTTSDSRGAVMSSAARENQHYRHSEKRPKDESKPTSETKSSRTRKSSPPPPPSRRAERERRELSDRGPQPKNASVKVETTDSHRDHKRVPMPNEPKTRDLADERRRDDMRREKPIAHAREQERKRGRSRSPPPSREQHKRIRTAADFQDNKKSENKSQKEDKDEGFANAGFPTSGGGIGKSRYGDFRNSAGAPQRPQTDNTNEGTGKARILPPSGTNQSGTTNGGFKIIVNELSQESIKREEHPLKGQRPIRRAFRGTSGRFVTSSQRGSRTTFGATHRAQTHGVGTREDAFGTSGRRHFGAPNDANAGSGARRVVLRREEPLSPPTSDKPPVLMSMVNPVSVPRGRIYFMHDHRDATDSTVAASKTEREQQRNSLYDPRQDRGGGGPTGDRTTFRGGRGPFRGRPAPGHRFSSTRASAEQRSDQKAPMGWRNFGATTGDESNAFSRNGESGGYFYRGRGGSSRGAPRFGDAEASLTGRPYWRSKADEDRVWSHDKFEETLAEESEEGAKLELVDEAEGEEPQQVDIGGGKGDEFEEEEDGLDGEERKRYDARAEEEGVFIDDEELVYD